MPKTDESMFFSNVVWGSLSFFIHLQGLTACLISGWTY